MHPTQRKRKTKRTEAKVKVESAVVDAVTGKGPAPPTAKAETTYLSVMLFSFLLILLEGLVLAGSGFLPEAADVFVEQVLYPSFSPQVIQMCSIMYSRWRLRKIPGPPPHLLLGNILDIIKAGGSHLAVHNWRKTYGNIFKIYFGRVAVIVVGDPDLARQVLYRFTNHMEFLAPGLAFMHAQHKA
ncbi:uncharacterized protein HaLaN_22802, partial [Haematococcus lacustris]